MRVSQISPDDIIEAHIRGRIVLGRVTAVDAGVVHFEPICPGAGWRHAKARDIIAHWRKAGRRTPNQDSPSAEKQ
jgi:hypothetical protein